MRIVKIAGGFALLIGGVVMLVTPGPGWLAIAGGLTLLASEFAWARRMLDALKTGATRLRTKAGGQHDDPQEAHASQGD